MSAISLTNTKKQSLWPIHSLNDNWLTNNQLGWQESMIYFSYIGWKIICWILIGWIIICWQIIGGIKNCWQTIGYLLIAKYQMISTIIKTNLSLTLAEQIETFHCRAWLITPSCEKIIIFSSPNLLGLTTTSCEKNIILSSPLLSNLLALTTTSCAFS